MPLSLNRWVYGSDNPIRFTDPSGFCPSCRVFLFPGAGNEGDLDEHDDLDDNLDREINLVRELRSRGITVETVYPYGAGMRSNHHIDNIDPLYPNILLAIGPSAYELSSIPAAKAEGIKDYFSSCLDNDRNNITFIGFSGGGQIAYSTAQSLTGKLQIDNLVLLGAPFRAYNGMSNIGHIWDLAWWDDDAKVREKIMGWDRFNSGYRIVNNNHYIVLDVDTSLDYEEVYFPEEDIYSQGGKCTLYSPHHRHYGTGDYFESSTTGTLETGDIIKIPSNGAFCSGKRMNYYLPGNDGSRLDFLVNFLINTVGIAREK